MAHDPNDPHNISRDDFRRFAGIPKSVVRDLKEEKVDLSTNDLFQYIDRALHGYGGYGYAGEIQVKSVSGGAAAEKNEPSCYEVAISCCDALEAKGYDKGQLSKLRSLFAKMQAASEAMRDAQRALSDLHRQRWDKNEVY